MPDAHIPLLPLKVSNDFDLLLDFLRPIAMTEMKRTLMLRPVGAAVGAGALSLLAVLPEDGPEDGHVLSNRLIGLAREQRDDYRAVAIAEDVRIDEEDRDHHGIRLSFEHESGDSRALLLPYVVKGRLRRRVRFAPLFAVVYEPRIWSPE
jgi:predicted nucleic acid-binding OB-fold protein